MSALPAVAMYGRCPKDGAALIMTMSVIQCPKCRDAAVALEQAKTSRDIGGSG